MEVKGCRYKSKFDLLTSTRVGSDLGNGLALCQSHSYILLREEVFVPKLKGA